MVDSYCWYILFKYIAFTVSHDIPHQIDKHPIHLMFQIDHCTNSTYPHDIPIIDGFIRLEIPFNSWKSIKITLKSYYIIMAS